MHLSLCFYHVNVVNIRILSLNVFSKTTLCPFKTDISIISIQQQCIVCIVSINQINDALLKYICLIYGLQDEGVPDKCQCPIN